MTGGELLAYTLVGGLVAFRLWRLAALDRILDPLRSRLYAAARPDGTGPVAELAAWLGCPWCSGFWIAGAVAAGLSHLHGTLWSWSTVVTWWASAAVVALCATVTGAESDA